MNNENLYKYLLMALVIIAVALRTQNINWDNGYFTHPDESHIYNVTSQLEMPSSYRELLSPQSSLNPHFFAYGSFPFYLLKFSAWVVDHFQSPPLGYGTYYTIARPLSAIFDIGTLLLVFCLTYLISQKKNWALIATGFYTFLVLPIQNAHFYTVDPQLTFWSMATLVSLTYALQTNKNRYLYLAGVCTSLAIASKFTGVVLVVPVIFVAFFKSFIQVETQVMIFKQQTFWIAAKRILALIILIVLVNFLAQPYVFIDRVTFVKGVEEQLQMRENAKVFPYTIQYLGTRPFVYPIEQMLHWGMGPVVTILGIVGWLWVSGVSFVKFFRERKLEPLLFIAITTAVLFIPTALSAVKFMRYYLPVYPLLTVMGSCFLMYGLEKRRLVLKTFVIITLFVPTVTWALIFSSIYYRPHPWVAASQWVHEKIPTEATIAVEHWDRSLPLYEAHRYNTITLGLYEPDSATKLKILTQQLDQADYLIISSNRLYESLPKWPERYPMSIAYYDALFSGKLGFVLIKEFTSYPQIGRLTIPDQHADESFTVYDHPRARVYQKVTYDKETTYTYLEQFLPTTR